ncbi:MAG: epoxide hydrolase family protein [Acidimicrobiia bacterium]
MRLQPFAIAVDEAELDELRRRLRDTRFPSSAPGPAWSQGTDLDYLRWFVSYWAEEFDWRSNERELNQFDHFLAEVGGYRIHYVHQRARHGGGLPLILIHGWPSSFTEYLAAIPLLTDPAAHGIDGPAFDVVVPSLPGYGFSPRPDRVGVNYREVADVLLDLMAGLGYQSLGAGGGDFGSGVAAHMAMRAPERLFGLHLTNVEIEEADVSPAELDDSEKAFIEERDQWDERERGYSSIQSTRPQTLGYALTDSPAGLAAWLLEKWRSWTDSGGDPTAHLPPNFLASLTTIYWVTRSITTSMRDYYDNRWHPASPSKIDVPTAIAVFGNQFVKEAEPPRSWVERLYNVQRWTQHTAGGHFAPVEEPTLFARDITSAFGQFTATPPA